MDTAIAWKKSLGFLSDRSGEFLYLFYTLVFCENEFLLFTRVNCLQGSFLYNLHICSNQQIANNPSCFND